MKAPGPCMFCGGGHDLAAAFDRPPDGEVRFLSFCLVYRRELYICRGCGHFRNMHEMDLDGFYKGNYADAIYGAKGIRAHFDKITGMAPECSDNRQRIKRVIEVSASKLKDRRLLDIGAGLGVFPYGMKEAGWNCVAADPDPRLVRHLEETVGVKALCGDFMDISIPDRFDLVSFNKVLEHTANPVAMLAKASGCLFPEGMVYMELPDGEMAIGHGAAREEFLMDHLHAFSAASAALLAKKAGFDVFVLDRLREPSGKFTIYAFLTVAK